jgi:hypothetical protein
MLGGVNIELKDAVNQDLRFARGPREDNETIKQGETPEDGKSKPAKNRQQEPPQGQARAAPCPDRTARKPDAADQRANRSDVRLT